MPGFNINGGGLGPSAVTEIARKHRWRITAFGNDIDRTTPVSLYAFKATRPKCEIDEIVVNHGQNEIFMPGRNHWNTVEFSFYEAVSASGGNRVTAFLKQWQQESTVNMDAAAIGTNYKRIVEYMMYQGAAQTSPSAPCARIIYTYTLIGCWPKVVAGSDLDYTDNSLSEVVVELRYDRSVELDGKS